MPVDNSRRSYPQVAGRGSRNVGVIGLHGAMTETTSALRIAADTVLSRLLGAEPGAARLREDQWRTVEALVAHGRRTLVVRRTGPPSRFPRRRNSGPLGPGEALDRVDAVADTEFSVGHLQVLFDGAGGHGQPGGGLPTAEAGAHEVEDLRLASGEDVGCLPLKSPRPEGRKDGPAPSRCTLAPAPAAASADPDRVKPYRKNESPEVIHEQVPSIILQDAGLGRCGHVRPCGLTGLADHRGGDGMGGEHLQRLTADRARRSGDSAPSSRSASRPSGPRWRSTSSERWR